MSKTNRDIQMVETHTISAPEKNWEQVFTYAKEKHMSISDVTRQAWTEFFKEEKSYRTVDLIVLTFLISTLIVLLLFGGRFL